MQTIWIGNAIVSFQTPEFLMMKRYKYFLIKKIWINEAIESLQTTESFSDEAIQLLLLLLPGGMRRFSFNRALKGQYHENFSSFSLKI